MSHSKTFRLSSSSRRRLLAAAALTGGLASASQALAADVHWNAATGNWTDDSKWVWDNGGTPTNNAPTVTDRAILDYLDSGAPGATFVNTDVAADPLALSIQNGSTLTIQPGGIVGTGTDIGTNNVDPVADALNSIRIGDGSAGTVVIEDGGALRNEIAIDTSVEPNVPRTNGTDDIYVGVGSGGVGTLTQSGATSVVFGRDIRVGADGATGTYTMNGGTANTNWFIIGRTGGTGTFNLTDGSVLAKFGSNSRMYVGLGRDSTGTINMSGGAIETTNEANVGYQENNQDGTGTVIQTGGTVTIGTSLYIGRGSARDGNNATVRGTGTYTLGANASSTASIAVNATAPADPGAAPMPAAGLYVGYNGGNGDLTINGGSVTVTNDMGVGYETRSPGATATPPADLPTGNVTQHAGTVSVARDLYLGYRLGSHGTYNLDGDAQLTVGNQLLIGYNNNRQNSAVGGTVGELTIDGNAVLTVADSIRMGPHGASGSITQTGGDVNANRIRLGQLGRDGIRSTGTYTMSGGTLDVSDNFWIGDASAGDGTFNLSGTGVVTVTNSMIVGRLSNGTCIFNQSGGTLTSGSFAIRNSTASSAGEYYLSNGTLNTGNLTNNNIFSYTGGTANVSGNISGIGTTTVGAGVTLAANSITQDAVILSGTLQARQGSGISKIANLTINPGGSFDMTNTKLIVTSSGAVGSWNGSEYTGVTGMVQSGRNEGTWDGAGIVTSLPEALTDYTTLGVATAADVLGIGPGDTEVWAGQTVTGSDTLVTYTYGGDANLDGVINIDDYGQIDFNVGLSGVVFGYFNGDFNLDGLINIDDYGIIDFNIGIQGPAIPMAGGAGADLGALSGVAAVPEPTAGAAVALLGAVLARRRRCSQG